MTRWTIMAALALAPGAAYAAEEGHGYAFPENLIKDPVMWVFYGLVLFFLILWRAGAFKAILGALDARSKAIADELAEAERLRRDAAALLAEYKAKRTAAESEARAIIAQARADSEAMRLQARQELDAELARREKLTEERIARAEAAAQAEIRALAAEAAIAAAEQMLKAELTPQRQAALVRDGADELRRRFG